MSTDIVERLREAFVHGTSGDGAVLVSGALIAQAADEIERLRAALNQVVTVCADNSGPTRIHILALDFIHQVAARALTGREGRE